MVVGKNINAIYFSELIKSEKPFPPAWERLQRVLDKHHVPYDFLKGTAEIWCRDYMPVQTGKDRFVQFVYDPGCHRGHPPIKYDPLSVNRLNGIEAEYADIKLDGGNVVYGYGKAIISERVFEENPECNPIRLVEKLERVLETEVIIIPCLDSALDMTGHADGYVRFVNANTLIGNDRRIEYKSWTRKMNKLLREKGFKYFDLPMFDSTIGEKGKSAIGSYVNYLETGNLIIMPVFEVEGNKDAAAYDVMVKTFPDRVVETVNINEIGIEGGLLNCISWTVES
jgi:agmatine deiminase